jgi:hypothetical protein
MPGEFSQCVLARWDPGFNDPYLVSWLMVALYLLVAGIAVAVMRRCPFPTATRRRERVFWGVVVGAMLLMALNKQADLQTLILATGRCLSQAQGWFEYRRLVQRIAVFALALTALGGGVVILWGLRRTLRRTALPLLGLGLTTAFVLTRAAGMFHVEGPLEVALNGGWPGRALELAGPLTILAAALILLRRPGRHLGR